MNIYDKFNFGKYSGKTLKEVYTGETLIQKKFLVRLHLQELLDLHFGKGEINIKLPASGSSSAFVKFANFNYFEPIQKNKNSFILTVTNNYILIDTDSSIIKANIFHNYLLEYLSLFNPTSYNIIYHKDSIIENLQFSEVSETIINLGPKISYIIWCIKNISDFYIIPSEIEELEKIELSDLRSFNIRIIKDNLLEYEHVYEKRQFTFPKEVKKLNNKKFKHYSEELERKQNRISHHEYINNYYEDECIEEAHSDSENPWRDVLGDEEAYDAYWNTH